MIMLSMRAYLAPAILGGLLVTLMAEPRAEARSDETRSDDTRLDETRAVDARAVPRRRDAFATQDGAALVLDTARSVVRWKGTKFRGRGKHEGTVRLASGFVSMCRTTACGGRFVLDMRSIAVTDIPVEDEVPRMRLQQHLKSRDFFWTEQYPTATFSLREVTLLNGERHRVHGDLLLRGVARSLTFDAQVETLADGGQRIIATLLIDRTKWGVEYRFDPIRNEIVDDDIELRLDLLFPKREAGRTLR